MIISRQNKQIKNYQKLKLKKYRDESAQFLVYGIDLVEKAKEKNVVVEIYTSNDAFEGTLVSFDIMKDFNQTETVFDILAVCKKENMRVESSRVLVLDDVQDPTNVGALIRSASAFGFEHIIMSDKCADLYNEKVIRASKGSIFDVFVERGSISFYIDKLHKSDFKIIATDAHKKGIAEVNSDIKLALVLGNEGAGISDNILKLCDYTINIDTKNVESLNVSVVGGILMNEWKVL